MEFIKTIDAIKWKDGNYEKTEEKTVEDEYAYLFIDCLPPRKFSVYPKNLDDFAIGYCLGEGLIKTNEDIEEISRLRIMQQKEESANMPAFADYLNIRE